MKINGKIVQEAKLNNQIVYRKDLVSPQINMIRIQNYYNPHQNQNYARTGDNIVVNMATSEALKHNPTLVLGGKEFEFPLQQPQYNVYSKYVVITEDMDLVEGEKIPVTVKGLEDLAGNIGEEVTSTGDDNYYVILDNTAPTYSLARIQSNNEDQHIAMVGNNIWVYVVIEKPLSIKPKCIVGGQEASLLQESSVSDGIRYGFRLTITEGMNIPEGNIEFKVYGYEDIAGNVGKDITETTDGTYVIMKKSTVKRNIEIGDNLANATIYTEFPSDFIGTTKEGVISCNSLSIDSVLEYNGIDTRVDMASTEATLSINGSVWVQNQIVIFYSFLFINNKTIYIKLNEEANESNFIVTNVDKTNPAYKYLFIEE